MRTRPTKFLDKKALKPVYGIEVFHNGDWMPAGDDDGPYYFRDEHERNMKRKELSRIKGNSNGIGK